MKIDPWDHGILPTDKLTRGQSYRRVERNSLGELWLYIKGEPVQRLDSPRDVGLLEKARRIGGIYKITQPVWTAIHHRTGNLALFTNNGEQGGGDDVLLWEFDILRDGRGDNPIERPVEFLHECEGMGFSWVNSPWAAEIGEIGLPEFHYMALFRYRQATSRNDPEAQFRVGVCNYYGKAYAEADKWFRLAAAQGHAEAQEMLNMTPSQKKAALIR